MSPGANHFPGVLRRTLDERNLSVRAFARLYAGPKATKTQVENARSLANKWLAGTNTPTRRSRIRIATVLGLPAEAFVEDQEPVTLRVVAGRLEELAAGLQDLLDGQCELLRRLPPGEASAPRTARAKRM